jgi:hypothetical protein
MDLGEVNLLQWVFDTGLLIRHPRRTHAFLEVHKVVIVLQQTLST